MLLSERTQSGRATYCMIPTMWHSGKGKTMGTVKKNQWFPGIGWEEGKMTRQSTEAI